MSTQYSTTVESIEERELVTVEQIAERLNRSIWTVYNLVYGRNQARREPFPLAAINYTKPKWYAWPEVEAWAIKVGLLSPQDGEA